MSNDYYNGGTFPTTGSAATSASMRSELASISVGFDKLPVLTGNGGKVVKINSGGTALEAGTAGDVVGPSSSVASEIALFDGTTGKLLKSATTTGLLKATSGVLSAASAGTDYQAAITASGILKGAGSGSVSAATAGTDYQAAISASGILKGAGGGSVSAATAETDYVSPTGSGTLSGKTITGIKETKVAMAASDISILAGNYFTKTISTTTTLTVSNVPSTGTAASFILDLTNGGSATINWWSGMKWAGGSAPTLTSSGRDVLGFFTHDGGTTWTGLLLGKDVK